jgi:hypothetical protein
MRFWDASAVVPLLVAETPREALLRLLKDDPVIAVWWGTAVECTSAVARREREGALSIAEATRALDVLRELSRSWQEVLPSEPVRQTAQRILRLHPLRAGDSLQLAAALIAAERDPETLAIVSLDERLNDAAQREGFRIVRP